QTADSATGEDRDRFTSNSPVAGLRGESAPGEEAATEKAAADGVAQKKKKKKKQKASSSKKEKEEPEISRKTKAEASGCLTKDASHQDETAQQSEDQLRKEVDWCVEQLELGLKTQKPTPKQAEEALRAIRTLRSDKAPLVKKRQVMRTLFGDYRRRMEEDWCQQLKLMQAAMKSARIVEVKEDVRRKSCQVVRKRSGACRKRQDSAESPSTSPRTSNTNSFRFTSSQENFYFNFF
ncbi:CH033 protein, partial [Crypturellus undulatus]|nr:CH033 protein [Crypturellus undulatus]